MTTSPVAEIRLAAGPEDIAAIRHLFARYGEHLAANPTGAANICIPDYDRELAELPGPYAPPGGALFLALVDGVPTGCCALRPLRPFAPHRADEVALEMKRLWVEPTGRGLGLGTALMEAAQQFAVNIGSSAMYLDTVPAAMPEANRLYLSFGFEKVERYNENPVPDVAFYRKSLAPKR